MPDLTPEQRAEQLLETGWPMDHLHLLATEERAALVVLFAAAFREVEQAVEAATWKTAIDYFDQYLEQRSAEAIAAYQVEAHRRGDAHHADNYDDLKESTKEWDRVLVRWVIESLRRLAMGGTP